MANSWASAYAVQLQSLLDAFKAKCLDWKAKGLTRDAVLNDIREAVPMGNCRAAMLSVAEIVFPPPA